MTEALENGEFLGIEELRAAAIIDFKNRTAKHVKVKNKKLSGLVAVATATAMIATVASLVLSTRELETERQNHNTFVLNEDKHNRQVNTIKKPPYNSQMFSETSNNPMKTEVVYITLPEDETTTDWNTPNEWNAEYSYGYDLSEWEIDLLVRAVQHETGNSPDYYPYGDFDTVQQYMAASIINRIGQPGFGYGYSTPYSVYDVLANSEQYGSLLWEIDYYDGYDERTRNNVYAVLNGTSYIPNDLYFERCSSPGEDYWSAANSFYWQYGNSSISIAYMSLTIEGRYIIFATNPGGAY